MQWLGLLRKSKCEVDVWAMASIGYEVAIRELRGVALLLTLGVWKQLSCDLWGRRVRDWSRGSAGVATQDGCTVLCTCVACSISTLEISTLTLQGVTTENYTTAKLEDTFRDLFLSENRIRRSIHTQRRQRSHDEVP